MNKFLTIHMVRLYAVLTTKMVSGASCCLVLIIFENVINVLFLSHATLTTFTLRDCSFYFSWQLFYEKVFSGIYIASGGWQWNRCCFGGLLSKYWLLFELHPLGCFSVSIRAVFDDINWIFLSKKEFAGIVFDV